MGAMDAAGDDPQNPCLAAERAGRTLRAVRDGVTVALRPVRGVAKETPLLLLVKLVLHPLLVWVAMTWLAASIPSGSIRPC